MARGEASLHLMKIEANDTPTMPIAIPAYGPHLPCFSTSIEPMPPQ